MLERNTHYDVFARSFCYSPRTGFSEEFLIPSSNWGVPLILLMLILVKSLSYVAHASFSEEFLSVLILMLVLARSLSYIPQASFNERFPLCT